MKLWLFTSLLTVSMLKSEEINRFKWNNCPNAVGYANKLVP